jgi:outer membrane protein OmpA-like peptidoglycan-associated protein
MTDHTSTQGRLEVTPVGTLRATWINLAPLLLAALLVGCSTKATHLGSLSGDPTLAGNDSSKRRASSTPGGPANAATSGSSDSASAAASEGAAGGSQEGAGAGRANDLASNEASTSSSGDSASGDSAGGVTGGTRAGGNRASSAGAKAGGASADAAGAASSGAASSGAASTAAASQGGAGGSAQETAAGDKAAGGAGAPSGGRPGTRNRSGASSTAGGGAAGDGNAEGDAEGADLSQGDSTAALEGSGGRNRGAVAGASGATAGAGGDTAAAMEGDGRIAAIDVPSGKVKVDEEYRPQTLGGALPLILGVNEEGRFDFDQYSLRPEVKHILDDLAAKLKSAEYDRLDIVGYTDRIGTTDYNRRLSELRAYAVAQYLMGKGVPQNKIHYEGRGERNPLTPSADCQGLAREDLITCLQKDRRVEIEASIHRKHATVVQ